MKAIKTKVTHSMDCLEEKDTLDTYKPSEADTAPLRNTIEEEVLRKIVAEYKRGRSCIKY